MTVKTMLLVQVEVLVVVVLVALFVWRYWYEPRQQQQQLTPATADMQPQVAPVPPAPVAPLKPPPAPVVTTPVPKAPVSVAPVPKAPPRVVPVAKPAPTSLVQNGDFAQGMQNWSYWKDGRALTNQIKTVRYDDKFRSTCVLWIENPGKQMVGVQQPVSLVSGVVYRLSAKVRSTATIDSSVIFGGRVALYLPPQPEQAIVWVTENTNWWARPLVFTNTVTGVGALYVHLGYGNAASTGEFTDVRLEKVSGGSAVGATPSSK